MRSNSQRAVAFRRLSKTRTKQCDGKSTTAEFNKAAKAYVEAAGKSEARKVKGTAAKAKAKREGEAEARTVVTNQRNRTCPVPGASKSSSRRSSSSRSSSSSSKKSGPKKTLLLKNANSNTRSRFTLVGKGQATKDKIQRDGFRVESRTRGGVTYYYKGPKRKLVSRGSRRVAGLKKKNK